MQSWRRASDFKGLSVENCQRLRHSRKSNEFVAAAAFGWAASGGTIKLPLLLMFRNKLFAFLLSEKSGAPGPAETTSPNSV